MQAPLQNKNIQNPFDISKEEPSSLRDLKEILMLAIDQTERVVYERKKKDQPYNTIHQCRKELMLTFKKISRFDD
jgi:hypothetical protein